MKNMQYSLLFVAISFFRHYSNANRITMDEVVKTICANSPNNETITFCQHLLPPRQATRPPPRRLSPGRGSRGGNSADYPSDYGSGSGTNPIIANSNTGGEKQEAPPEDPLVLESESTQTPPTTRSVIYFAQRQVLDQQNQGFGLQDNNNPPPWAPTNQEQTHFQPINNFPNQGEQTTLGPDSVLQQQQQQQSGQSQQQQQQPQSVEDSVSQYCSQFLRQFVYNCRVDQSSLSEEGLRFCQSYSFTCNKQPEENAPSTNDYCRQFRDNFDYFCEDPIKFGSEAIVYCPYFSELCGVSVRERTTQPTSIGNFGGKLPNSAQIKTECNKNRQLAQQFCFGKGPLFGMVKTRCDLYKRFCTNQATTPIPLLL